MTSTLAPRKARTEIHPVVTGRGIRVVYGDTVALDGVDIDLRPGEVVALLGSSGSGKSTLMRTLTGFTRVTHGEITVAGRNPVTATGRALRRLRADVGHVFQQFNLIPRLSVMKNVLTGGLYSAGPLNLVGAFSHEQRTRAIDLLDRVGIAHKATEPARSLSGGQQQRVAIARALMQNPQLILADEPVASLDPRLAASVLGLLRDIARSEGIPVLVSLHVLDLALEFSDRIVGLKNGRTVVADATSALTAADLTTLYDQDDAHDHDD